MHRAAVWAIVLALSPLLIFSAWQVADSRQQHQRCAEDDPCWNCETMGNRICGPGAPRP